VAYFGVETQGDSLEVLAKKLECMGPLEVHRKDLVGIFERDQQILVLDTMGLVGGNSEVDLVGTFGFVEDL